MARIGTDGGETVETPVERPTGGEEEDLLEVREDYPTRPVPEEERRSWFATLTVWAGWTISITAFLVGGPIGNGLPVGQAVGAILLGNVVLAVVGALIGYIGMKTGLSTYLIAQTVFGRYGSIIISVIVGIFAMGFVGVFAGATGQFVNAQLASVPVWGGALLFAILVTATALYGFVGLEYLSKVAVPALWILAVWALVVVVGEIPGGLGGVVGLQPAAPASFSFGVTLAISTWIVGASITADIGRYAKNKWHVLLGAFGGWVAGAAFLESVSAISALGVGDGDVVAVMISLGLFVPAFIVFLAAMWTTGDNNLYIFSLALTSLSDVLGYKHLFSKAVWVIIGGVLVFIGGAAGLYSQFVSFLLTIAVTIPPMAGIFIARFFVLGDYKRSADQVFADIREGRRLISAPAFVTWIIASGFAATVEFGSPAVNALILSIVLYTVLYYAVEEYEVIPEAYR